MLRLPSFRKIHLPQERLEARVAAEITHQRVAVDLRQAVITLQIRPIEPIQCLVHSTREPPQRCTRRSPRSFARVDSTPHPIALFVQAFCRKIGLPVPGEAPAGKTT
jgi:hypothetical protein